VAGYNATFYRSHWTDASSYSLVPGLPASFDLDHYHSPYRHKLIVTNTGRDYVSGRYAQEGYKLGDDIRFNEHWSALVGVSRTRIKAENLTSTGDVAEKYDEKKLTPTLSLIYKPVSWWTNYVTYIEALEPGTIVGNEYANAGEVFKPYVSKQMELGAKIDWRGLFLTGALFRIEKENGYNDNALPLPTYTRDGMQVHDGIEFTVTGKATDRLTLLGGVTFLDPTIKKTDNPDLKGKEPEGVAKRMIKLYGVYQIPGISGLYLTGGAYYTGDRMHRYTINGVRNTPVKLPAYVIGDVGARYVTSLYGQETTFRLNVANVTDKEYWSSNVAMGMPRTIAFSATMKF
jgi:iron complex outermembrane receptor protein